MDKLIVPIDFDVDVIEEASLPSCGLYSSNPDEYSRKSPKRSFAVSHTSPFAPSSKRARSTSCPSPLSPSTPFSPSTSSVGYELFVRSRRSSSQSMIGSTCMEEYVPSHNNSPQTLPTAAKENLSGSPQAQTAASCELKAAAFFSISADEASLYFALEGVDVDQELAELAVASTESITHNYEPSLLVCTERAKSIVPSEVYSQTSATPALQNLRL